MKDNNQWIKTDYRFVVLFDIMGFKDMVQRNSHKEILKKLTILKETIGLLESVSATNNAEIAKTKISHQQTRSITFSDSIIMFSKGAELEDAAKILVDSYVILKKALDNEIPIKGSISFGEITVNFEDSLFFGQPIIDAYLLHEEFQMYNVIVDHHFETKLKVYGEHQLFSEVLTKHKTSLKSGKVNHTILMPQYKKNVQEQIDSLNKLYASVSGKPRIYIDNSIEFLESILDKKTK